MEKLRKIIDKQRKGKEDSPVWTVGEQLLDIAAESQLNLELITKDLQIEEMDLAHAEKKIKAWADKQKQVGGCVCVSPKVADGILREFYGLSPRDESSGKVTVTDGGYIDIGTFL